MKRIDKIMSTLARLGLFLVNAHMVWASYRLAREVHKGNVSAHAEQPEWAQTVDPDTEGRYVN